MYWKISSQETSVLFHFRVQMKLWELLESESKLIWIKACAFVLSTEFGRQFLNSPQSFPNWK